MREHTTHYHANSHSKAKDRRGAADHKRGKYTQRRLITERNRARNQAKHHKHHPNDLTAIS